jgi:coenzyme PQQ biosynthesis protein PqqD
MKDHTRPHFVRGVRLRWDPVRQQHMLLFPEGALVLNATAGAVLELCDGQRTIDAIAAELEKRYPGANIKPDVYHLLSRIAERGLLYDDG